MKLLLDTCAILWAVSDPERLSERAKALLLDKGSELFVSPMSCAEIACLVERKRIQLGTHWRAWFRTHVEKNGWEVLPIDLLTIEEAYSLPDGFHRDPADRMLVAAARLNLASIVTADRLIADYPHVQVEW